MAQNKNTTNNLNEPGDVSIPDDTFVMRLVGAVNKEHLCSVEFGNFIKIKKQIGNNTGTKIEIEFNQNKQIRNIKFEYGGYNEPLTLKNQFDKLFDIIFDA